MNPLPSSFPKIRIWGDNNYGSGANNALRGFLQALRCLGLGSDHVQVIPISNGSGLYQEMGEHDWLHPYVYRPVIEDQINLAFVHPSFLAGRHTTVGSRYNIAYCPWETDKLPKQFVDELNKYDQVWAPCGLVKQTFKNSGVTAPIHVVQHAVQSELLEAEPSADDSEMVNFYFIGSFNPRKNVEGLIRAWCKTLDAGWGPTTPVRLTLHLVTASRDEAAVQGHSWMAQEMIKQYMVSLGPRRQDVARFGVLTAPRRFANIVDLHRRSNVFVTASRGEGFSLAAAEAAAMGNLVIGTDAAAPFFDDVWWRPEGRQHPPDTFRALKSMLTPIAPMPEVAGYELDQNWWEPQGLAEAFIAARANLVQAQDRPQRAAAARLYLSPAAVADRVRPLLEEAAEVLSRSGW